MTNLSKESGAVNPLLIGCIVLSLVSAGLAGFGVWSFTNYLDQKNNVDAKINTAVIAAKDEQASQLQKVFAAKEKDPHTTYSGPADLGHVTFSYPKTWSVYIADDGTDSDSYEAYLNPKAVPTVGDTQSYALRVEVMRKSYDEVLKTYESAVTKGDLKSSPITVNGFNGIRLDGVFSSTRQGSSVIFKIRDKTLVLSSDTADFKADFDNTVVATLKFNP
jgi:hypothetical protein